MDEDPDGNVSHIADHHLTKEDVEHVLEHSVFEGVSRSFPHDPCRHGFTEDGRFVFVVFEWLEDGVVYPITAYEIED